MFFALLCVQITPVQLVLWQQQCKLQRNQLQNRLIVKDLGRP